MRAHADGPTHKKKAGEMVAALRLKAKRMAALGVEVVKDTKLVPHEVLRKKVMWDHRVPDYNDTLVLGKKVKAADGSSVDDKRLTAGWFGMTKQPTMAFIGQWNLWVGEARTKEELALEPGEYWRSKDKSYPLLYKLGLWYAAIPLSAVSAERAIGLMREVETPKRNRMKKASWHAECFLRYNKWLTEGIFDDVSGDVATLQKCIKRREFVPYRFAGVSL